MVRIPTVEDLRQAQIAGGSAPAQINPGVAYDIGRAGAAMGNAIEGLGRAFSGLAKSRQTASDSLAESEARLEWLKANQANERMAYENAQPDGSGLEAWPQANEAAIGQIFTDGPGARISDKDRRERLKIQFQGENITGPGDQSYQDQKKRGYAHFTTQLSGVVQRSAEMAAADPSKALDAYDATEVAINAARDAGTINEAQAEIMRQQARRAVTDSAWTTLAREDPEAAMRAAGELPASRTEAEPAAQSGSKALQAAPQTGGIAAKITFESQQRRGTSNEPYRYGGALAIGGQEFTFVTGGKGRGSAPQNIEMRVSRYESEADRKRAGRDTSYIKEAYRLQTTMADPAYPKAPRKYIIIHPGKNSSHGCIAIPPKEWPAFKRAMDAQIKRDRAAGRETTFRLGGGQPAQGQNAATKSLSGPADQRTAPPGQGAVPRQRVTAYSPTMNKERRQLEGGLESSIAGPDGKNIVRTLDDYANGRSNYITVAGHPRFYGNEYTIPKLTYIDPEGNRKVLTNVRAVVHDTGEAFYNKNNKDDLSDSKNAPEGRFDVPIGRDRGNDAMAAHHGQWERDGIEFIRRGKGGDAQPVRLASAAPAEGEIVTDAIADDVDASGVHHEPVMVQTKRGPIMLPGPPDPVVIEKIVKEQKAAAKLEIPTLLGGLDAAIRTGTPFSQTDMSKAAAAVRAYGTGEQREKFEDLAAQYDVALTFKGRSVEDMDDTIADMQVQRDMQQADIDGAILTVPRPMEQATHLARRLDAAQKYRAAFIDRAQKAPLATAEKEGLFRTEPMNITSAKAFTDWLGLRKDQAYLAAGKYAAQPQFFSDQEANRLAQVLRETPEDVQLAYIGMIQEKLGPNAGYALREIGQKDPIVGYAGALSLKGTAYQETSLLILRGRRLIDQADLRKNDGDTKPSFVVDRRALEEAYLAYAGGAISERHTQHIAAAVDAGRAIATALRVREGASTSDAEIAEKAIALALGAVEYNGEILGGVGAYRGQKIVLPSLMDEDQFEAAIDLMADNGLQHYRPDGPPGSLVIVNTMGGEKSYRTLANNERNYTLKTVGDGKYQVFHGDPSYGIKVYVWVDNTEPVGPLIIDVAAYVASQRGKPAINPNDGHDQPSISDAPLTVIQGQAEDVADSLGASDAEIDTGAIDLDDDGVVTTP